METQPTLHASAVLIRGHGILIRGPSGVGKSRLAVALLQQANVPLLPKSGQKTGASSALIGDDRLVLSSDGEDLSARAAQNLEGRIEVRGIGICGCDYVHSARLHLALDIVPSQEMERMPESHTTIIQQCTLFHIRVPIGDLAHQLSLSLAALDMWTRKD